MKHLSKLLAIVCALVLVFSLAACGGGQPAAPAPAEESAAPAAESAAPAEESAAPAETPAAAADDGQVYELAVSTFQPAMSPNTVKFKECCDKLMDDSNGRLNITFYDSGTLLAAPDVFKGVQDGLADIAFMPGNFGYDYLTISSRLFYLPFLGLNDARQAGEIYAQMRTEFPEIDQEFEDVGLVNLGGFFTTNIDLYFHDAATDIQTLADLQGKKIGVLDSFSTELIQNAGGTPVFTTNAEMYTSLDNGVYAGILSQPSVLSVSGCEDTIGRVVEIGEGGAARQVSLFIMNKGKFDSLPADLQELVRDAFVQLNLDFCEITDQQGKAFREAIAANGAQTTVLSDEEVEKFASCAEDIQAQAIEEVTAKGYPGQEIFDRIQELAAQ